MVVGTLSDAHTVLRSVSGSNSHFELLGMFEPLCSLSVNYGLIYEFEHSWPSGRRGTKCVCLECSIINGRGSSPSIRPTSFSLSIPAIWSHSFKKCQVVNKLVIDCQTTACTRNLNMWYVLKTLAKERIFIFVDFNPAYTFQGRLPAQDWMARHIFLFQVCIFHVSLCLC